jgi:hypothetical protein
MVLPSPLVVERLGVRGLGRQFDPPTRQRVDQGKNTVYYTQYDYCT